MGSEKIPPHPALTPPYIGKSFSDIASQLNHHGVTASASTDSVFDRQKLAARLEQFKEERRAIRRKMSLKVLKSIVSNPSYVKADEMEVAKEAVAYTDALLHVLEVSESVADKMNGDT